MAATALGNIPLSTTIYPSADVDAALSGLASGVSEEIASAVSTAWKAGGSKAPTDLTSALLVAANEGKVYNMSASGTTDSNFMEGAGKPYTAGTDVAVINAGTESSPVYKFNVLGVQDSSVVKSVNNITPTNGNVTIPGATVSGDGLMTSGDKAKLNNIASGAEVNQNAFSVVAVSGQGNVEASGKTDTLNLAPGENISMSVESGTVTISAQVPSGVVQSFNTDSGEATPFCGIVDIHGDGGVSVVSSGGGIVVDGSSLSGAVSGVASGLSSLSGVVSGLKNFSKVTVVNSSGTAVTNGTLTPGSNADDTLKLQAGGNVSLSVAASTKTVNISVPNASDTTKGVVEIASSISEAGTVVPTAAQVSGAISGLASDVNQTLSGYVAGSNLHTNLVNNGHSNPSTTPTSGTIYSLIKALHASDNTSES